MHFCKNCDNMYYCRVTPQNELIYYCRKCNYEDKDLAKDKSNLCVSKLNFNQETISYKNNINEFTKLDPTLPRTSTIVCPNKDCITNDEKEKVGNEVIYIRYDDANMKYSYLCVHCDKVWKLE